VGASPDGKAAFFIEAIALDLNAPACAGASPSIS